TGGDLVGAEDRRARDCRRDDRDRREEGERGKGGGGQACAFHARTMSKQPGKLPRFLRQPPMLCLGQRTSPPTTCSACALSPSMLSAVARTACTAGSSDLVSAT